DETINYVRHLDWDGVVRRLTAKRGADVIIETVGTSTWERSIRALGKGGRLVTSGSTSAPSAPRISATSSAASIGSLDRTAGPTTSCCACPRTRSRDA